MVDKNNEKLDQCLLADATLSTAPSGVGNSAPPSPVLIPSDSGSSSPAHSGEPFQYPVAEVNPDIDDDDDMVSDLPSNDTSWSDIQRLLEHIPLCYFDEAFPLSELYEEAMGVNSFRDVIRLASTEFSVGDVQQRAIVSAYVSGTRTLQSDDISRNDELFVADPLKFITSLHESVTHCCSRATIDDNHTTSVGCSGKCVSRTSGRFCAFVVGVQEWHHLSSITGTPVGD